MKRYVITYTTGEVAPTQRSYQSDSRNALIAIRKENEYVAEADFRIFGVTTVTVFDTRHEKCVSGAKSVVVNGKRKFVRMSPNEIEELNNHKES